MTLLRLQPVRKKGRKMLASIGRRQYSFSQIERENALVRANGGSLQ